MTPLWVCLYLEGAADQLPAIESHARRSGTRRRDELALLEEAWTGAARPVDHAYWAAQPTADPFLIEDAEGPVAFGYGRAKQATLTRALNRLLIRPERGPRAADPRRPGSCRPRRSRPGLPARAEPGAARAPRGRVPRRRPRPVPVQRPVARRPRPVPAQPGDALGRLARGLGRQRARPSRGRPVSGRSCRGRPARTIRSSRRRGYARHWGRAGRAQRTHRAAGRRRGAAGSGSPPAGTRS